jgi:hypothetical protein
MSFQKGLLELFCCGYAAQPGLNIPLVAETVEVTFRADVGGIRRVRKVWFASCYYHDGIAQRGREPFQYRARIYVRDASKILLYGVLLRTGNSIMVAASGKSSKLCYHPQCLRRILDK